ncbi:atherin-like [Panicum virgatum]|uniref:atherin-like n=1 Tax=Panicum virgatum TaxID=38727 RepID=UPI0019D53B49|nr:atherin-like [Panicum virgatum]
MAALGSSAGGLPPRRSGTREGFVPLHSTGGPARARAPPLPLHPGVGASPVDLAAAPSAHALPPPTAGPPPLSGAPPSTAAACGGTARPGAGQAFAAAPGRPARRGPGCSALLERPAPSGAPPRRLRRQSSRGPPSASSSSSTRRELLPSASAAATVEQSLGFPTCEK